MKKYTPILLLAILLNFATTTVEAEGWNASKWMTPPAWVTTPITATTSAVSKTTKATATAVTKTTKATWTGFTKGTATAWKKTTAFLDPFPDPKPSEQAKQPQTVSEFFAQERPE